MRPNNVVISIKDPLTISVSNTEEVTCVRGIDGKIVELHVPEVATIAIGNKLTLGRTKDPYRVNSIVEREGMGTPIYDLRIATRTKASLFIIPMFPGLKRNYFYDNLLLNCFIGTPEQDDVIALLYRFSGAKSFMEMEGSLKKLKTFESMEDPSNKTVLYVFNVPDKYKDDYDHFIAGRYSKFSDSYKRRILEFHGVERGSVIGQILNKAKARKKVLEDRIYDEMDKQKGGLPDDAELYSVPNLFSEVYSPEIYSI
tara:strand:- start:739 stop:1506 length:768 start_codon:yes stop_codon:yes gene_type:complete